MSIQVVWMSDSVEQMKDALEAWCELADDSGLRYLKKFAASLRWLRIEAGNISIGMIRKRARDTRDTEYFKLKTR